MIILQNQKLTIKTCSRFVAKAFVIFEVKIRYRGVCGRPPRPFTSDCAKIKIPLIARLVCVLKSKL